MQDSQGNALAQRDRVRWGNHVGTVQEIINRPNEHDIVIDFDGLGRYVYMQHLVAQHLTRVEGQGELNADTPMGPITIAAGK